MRYQYTNSIGNKLQLKNEGTKEVLPFVVSVELTKSFQQLTRSADVSLKQLDRRSNDKERGVAAAKKRRKSDVAASATKEWLSRAASTKSVF